MIRFRISFFTASAKSGITIPLNNFDLKLRLLEGGPQHGAAQHFSYPDVLDLKLRLLEGGPQHGAAQHFSYPVIGGGAIIIGHIVERGKLKLKKVKIGKNVTVGSHCTIMPGCEIGDNAIIGASAVLLKDTKVEANDVWFGIPAESIRHKKEGEKELN